MKRTSGEGVSHEGFLDYLDSKIPDAIKKIRDEKDEKTLIAQLKAENASLWALAKFGREMLSARNMSPIPLSDVQMAGLRAVINDLAELCDLLEIDPNSEILMETPLAQLPEKRE